MGRRPVLGERENFFRIMDARTQVDQRRRRIEPRLAIINSRPVEIEIEVTATAVTSQRSMMRCGIPTRSRDTVSGDLFTIEVGIFKYLLRIL